MSRQTPNREIPKDIAPTINGLRALAITELRNGNHKRAENLYIRELEIISRKEQERQASIHKGATYYNLGFSRLLQNRGEDASEDVLQAYIEDLFNVVCGKEEEADKAPARRTLLKMFGITDDTLKPLKDSIREYKKNLSKWIKASSSDFLKLFGKQIIQRAKIPTVTTRLTPDMVKEQGKLPDRKRSVFIGGPFRIAAYLKELRRIFLQVRPRYTPFMSTDFTFEEERTHDSCMDILASCGHAIFDVSTEAGQYAEIEFARIKKIPSLLVFSALEEKDKAKPPVPAIIRTVGFPVKGFHYLDELEEIFKEFLPEEPRNTGKG